MVIDALRSFAQKNNIIAGACHAAPLEKARLLASPFVPFVSSDIEKRTNPDKTLSGVESIIVIGVGAGDVFSKAFLEKGSIAQLSSLGIDDDYHVKVKNLLRELADELKQIYGEFRYKILVDGSGLDERALAHRAGLGFFGRNGLIISSKFGSRFNIGCMLTDIPLEDVVLSDDITTSCPPDCRLCIDACPGGALGSDYLNAKRCVSYLTQKDDLTEEEAALLGQQLYGCDICQDVCPFNAPRKPAFVDPKLWLDMDDETFAREYGHTAMLWRGTKLLRRNAEIVRRNFDTD